MKLFVITEDAPRWIPGIMPADPADVLRWQGWETCDECEDGLLYGTPSFTESHPLPVPCPDCAHGLVPPAGMVEAAADMLWHHLDARTGPGSKAYEVPARAALVAAARWEGD